MTQPDMNPNALPAIPTDAGACPKCGGETGWSATETQVMKVIAPWSGEPEYVGMASITMSDVTCDDCGAMFVAPTQS